MSIANQSGYKDYYCPIGTIVAYAGDGAPPGWIKCDGTHLIKSDYPELFRVIGHGYGGVGDDFQVPDLEGVSIQGAVQPNYIVTPASVTPVTPNSLLLTAADIPTLTTANFPNPTITLTGKMGATYAQKNNVDNFDVNVFPPSTYNLIGSTAPTTSTATVDTFTPSITTHLLNQSQTPLGNFFITAGYPFIYIIKARYLPPPPPPVENPLIHVPEYNYLLPQQAPSLSGFVYSGLTIPI